VYARSSRRYRVSCLPSNGPSGQTLSMRPVAHCFADSTRLGPNPAVFDRGAHRSLPRFAWRRHVYRSPLLAFCHSVRDVRIRENAGASNAPNRQISRGRSHQPCGSLRGHSIPDNENSISFRGGTSKPQLSRVSANSHFGSKIVSASGTQADCVLHRIGFRTDRTPLQARRVSIVRWS
jgi:hypothetical protein